MKNTLLLTISVASIASLVSLNAMASPSPDDAASTPATAVKSEAPHSGGKCASGKCGTEKIYSQAKLDHNPDGALVQARDGKCGLSGKGFSVAQSTRDKLAEGVCGQ